MATLTKSVLGKVSGALGDITFRNEKAAITWRHVRQTIPLRQMQIPLHGEAVSLFHANWLQISPPSRILKCSGVQKQSMVNRNTIPLLERTTDLSPRILYRSDLSISWDRILCEANSIGDQSRRRKSRSGSDRLQCRDRFGSREIDSAYGNHFSQQSNR